MTTHTSVEVSQDQGEVARTIADLRAVRRHHEFTRDRIGQPGCPVRLEAAEHVERIDRAIAALSTSIPPDMVLVPREELGRIRTSMALLQANSEGCAQNHYGDAFDLHGMPGWLAGTKRDLIRFWELLSAHEGETR